MDDDALDLTGHLLVAMPGMGDARFAHAVIYICAHSADGAMGLIVNRPATDVRFSDLLDQLGIESQPGVRDIRVHLGGPVENGRGFVLHSTDYTGTDATLQVSDTVAMTATIDVLERMAEGRGPRASMLALGYAGWAPGQLEAEIAQNGWLTCAARDDIVFGRANDHKWTAALKSLGIDPVALSGTSGRA